MEENQQSYVHLARYITIAVDIATRVARGEYRIGQKIFGRSTLAGKYNVSPETIRRALTLLQERGIVDVMAGIGVVVKSDLAAREYLADYNQKKVLLEIQERLEVLLKDREKLNLEKDRLTNQLLDYTFKMAGRLQKLEEVSVPANSPLLGISLSEAGFRARTGATVLSIYRNGHEIVSPEANTQLRTGDVLLVVGTHEAAEMVRQMIMGEMIYYKHPEKG
ncbi:MAG: GntR family transcriptional regulator [Firmicutes bacterium]|nr:GntR family transcriptional regulator [Bacillota bacterium]